MKKRSQRLANAIARYNRDRAMLPRGYFAYQREAVAYVQKLLARLKPPDDFIRVGNEKYSRCEWARMRYNFIHRYERPFDESKHDRVPAAHPNGGQFQTKDGAETPIHEAPIDIPETSGVISTKSGTFIGNFDSRSGWVYRNVTFDGD